MSRPTVSVIIPTYNRREYVQEAIDSVLAQTYTDHEIIVIDDGSTDGTGEALRERYGDRIIYEWQENQGESVARNRGIALAQGEYIAFLDSDDLWLPEKLEKQVAYLHGNPQVALVFSKACLVGPDGAPLLGERCTRPVSCAELTPMALCWQNNVSGPSTVLVRRSVLAEVGGFDAQLRYGEDWDLWLRISFGHQLASLDVALAGLRRHTGTQSYYPSVSGNRLRVMDHVMLLSSAFRHWPGRIPTDLRERALAHQYAQGFLWEWAVGNKLAAELDLAQVQELDPQLLSDPCFAQHLTDQAALLAEHAEPPFARADDYLMSLRSRLAGVCDPSALSRALGSAYQTLAYIACQAGSPVHGLRLWMRALWYNPRQPGKRGMASNIIRVLGRRASNAHQDTRQEG